MLFMSCPCVESDYCVQLRFETAHSCFSCCRPLWNLYETYLCADETELKDSSSFPKAVNCIPTTVPQKTPNTLEFFRHTLQMLEQAPDPNADPTAVSDLKRLLIARIRELETDGAIQRRPDAS
jgi:hypothetical protein